LVADFSDPMQWVIQSATRVGGRPLRHDQLIQGDLPDGVTYNCAIRDLLIGSTGSVPYGGIRIHGCPGALVDGVGIDRVGCGLLINYSFGGRFDLHVRPHYYGVAAWDDANANSLSIYCAHGPERPREVPEAYRLAFMRQLDGRFVDTLKLSTNAHGARPVGLLCGSITSSSVGNTIDAVIEQFPTGVMLFHAYATEFGRCYLEGDSERMKVGMAATRSRFGIAALHAYLSGAGELFDFGLEVFGRVFASGITHAASFGKPPEDDGSSNLTLEGVALAPPVDERPLGLNFDSMHNEWTPLNLAAGWRAADGGYATPAVRFNSYAQQVELRGALRGKTAGLCFSLPTGFRPRQRRRFLVAGGVLDISPSGRAEIMPSTDLVSLDNAGFSLT
jgi:hypothetical protein